MPRESDGRASWAALEMGGPGAQQQRQKQQQGGRERGRPMARIQPEGGVRQASVGLLGRQKSAVMPATPRASLVGRSPRSAKAWAAGATSAAARAPRAREPRSFLEGRMTVTVALKLQLAESGYADGFLSPYFIAGIPTLSLH